MTGIYRMKNGKYKVAIKFRGEVIYGGIYDDIEDAKEMMKELDKKYKRKKYDLQSNSHKK